jgi:hypothetical protein
MRTLLLYFAVLLQSISLTAAAEESHAKHQQNFYDELSAVEKLGQNPSDRPAALKRLHRMWTKYDVLRRPAIAYLMCQFGDLSGVAAVSKAFFNGEYDTGREVEPDGSAAGANATDAAFRTVILYGTPRDRQQLLSILKLSDDPLRKRDGLCDALLGLSSTEYGPGLPPGYSKAQFPMELAIGCLDYTEEVSTTVDAPNGSVISQRESNNKGSIIVQGAVNIYTQRGCDHAAQTIQNLTDKDFGHRVSDPVSKRDDAIKTIKRWWHESHTSTGGGKTRFSFEDFPLPES